MARVQLPIERLREVRGAQSQNLHSQFRQVLLNGVPDDSVVHGEVSVRQRIAHLISAKLQGTAACAAAKVGCFLDMLLHASPTISRLRTTASRVFPSAVNDTWFIPAV